MLLLFFERKCFVMALLVFFVICYVISNWYTVKIVMLFQFEFQIWNNININMRVKNKNEK